MIQCKIMYQEIFRATSFLSSCRFYLRHHSCVRWFIYLFRVLVLLDHLFRPAIASESEPSVRTRTSFFRRTFPWHSAQSKKFWILQQKTYHLPPLHCTPNSNQYQYFYRRSPSTIIFCRNWICSTWSRKNRRSLNLLKLEMAKRWSKV
jgi:hypothetical protein